MERPSSSFNVPDLVIGCVLLVFLPLGTLIVMKGSKSSGAGESEGGPGAKAKDRLTIDEIREARDEYFRMYNDNARLFLIRSRDDRLDVRHRAEEVGWADSTLRRCRKGLEDLLRSARERAAFAEDQELIHGLEKRIAQIDDDLRTLPVGLQAMAADPPPVEVRPSPPPAPVQGTGVDGAPPPVPEEPSAPPGAQGGSSAGNAPGTS